MLNDRARLSRVRQDLDIAPVYSFLRIPFLRSAFRDGAFRDSAFRDGAFLSTAFLHYRSFIGSNGSLPKKMAFQCR